AVLCVFAIVAAGLGWARGAMAAGDDKDKKKTPKAAATRQPAGTPRAQASPRPAPRTAKPPPVEDVGESPDLPSFLQGSIDMEEYLALRNEYFADIQGFYPRSAKQPDPRGIAIRMLESQERARAQEQCPGCLPPANWEEIGPNPIPNGQTTS